MRLSVWLPVVAFAILSGSPQSTPSRTGYVTRSAKDGLQRLEAEILAQYRIGNYPAILELARRGARLALDARDPSSQARFLLFEGNALFSTWRYAEAAQAYLSARRLARRYRLRGLLVKINTNLSSLYLHQGNPRLARQYSLEAYDLLVSRPVTGSAALVLVQAAIVQARLGLWEQASRLFSEAARSADTGGNVDQLTSVLDYWGYEHLLQGHLEAASSLIFASSLYRTLARKSRPASATYLLGLLFLRFGEPERAVRLLDKALADSHSHDTPLPLWQLYSARAEAFKALGRYRQAYSDQKAALEIFARHRAHLVPAESFWIPSAADHHQLAGSFAQICYELYRRTSRPRYAWESLAAVAGARAWALRSLVESSADWQRRLPPHYWSLLEQLRRAYPGSPSAGLDAEVERLHLRLSALEAEAGLSQPSSRLEPDALDTLRRRAAALGPDAALIVFQLGHPYSLRWALSPEKLDFTSIASAQTLEPLAARFHDGVQKGLPEAQRLASLLYRHLFGSLPPWVLSRQHWVLSPEGRLFPVPFGALLAPNSRGGHDYLARQHAIRLVHAPLSLPVSHEELRPVFVGVGDAIYNLADPRCSWAHRARGAASGSFAAWATGLDGFHLQPQLPRLPGSGREVNSCAHLLSSAGWRTVVLTGQLARVEHLQPALASKPYIVHLATHFIPVGDSPQQAAALFSIAAGWTPQLLLPEEISRWRYSLGVVTLSGCGSGQATVLPGEGLMGMARSWLAAGARAVIVSNWPVPDEDGSLLAFFYARLAGKPATLSAGEIASAWRLAQLEFLAHHQQEKPASAWASYALLSRE